MDMTEKNGQPSMEEILASIRRIISEEPADAISLDFGGKSEAPAPDGALDEPSEFELPSMFRAGPQPVDKPGPLLGRLTEAIRGTAVNGAAGDARHAAAFATDVASPVGSAAAPAPSRVEQPYHEASALSALRLAGGERRAENELHAPRPVAAVVPSVPEPQMPMAAATGGEVKRQMVPFMDQRFQRMTAPGPAPVAPASVAPLSAPVPEARPAVDFGAIVPGQMDHAPQQARPLYPAPGPHYNGQAVGPQGYAPGGESHATYQDAPAARAPSTDHQAGGFEDATAELLRPMLRQWLAENMPRMVEKALHIEVAQSVRSGRKPPGAI